MLPAPRNVRALALEGAGLLIEALREPIVPDRAVNSDRGRRWQRLPLLIFLPIRVRTTLSIHSFFDVKNHSKTIALYYVTYRM